MDAEVAARGNSIRDEPAEARLPRLIVLDHPALVGDDVESCVGQSQPEGLADPTRDLPARDHRIRPASEYFPFLRDTDGQGGFLADGQLVVRGVAGHARARDHYLSGPLDVRPRIEIEDRLV